MDRNAIVLELLVQPCGFPFNQVQVRTKTHLGVYILHDIYAIPILYKY